MKQYRKQQRRTLALSAWAYILFLLAIAAWLYFSFLEARREARAAAERELASILANRQVELLDLQEEIFDDANYIYNNRAFYLLAQNYLGTGSESSRHEMTNWLRAYQEDDQFDGVFLLDAQSQPILRIPENPAPGLAPALAQKAEESLQSRRIMLVDLYRDSADQQVYFGLAIPIYDHEQSASTLLGCVLLRTNAEDYLYNYLDAPVMGSLTSESFLVRREGETALLLSDLRSPGDTALSLRIPLSENANIIARAALESQGIFVGVDAAGVETLAAVQSVPGTGWILAVSRSMKEVYAPAYKSFWQTTFVGGVAVVLLGLASLLILRQRDLQFYRMEANAMENMRESEERFRRAFENSPVGVALISPQGLWLKVNRQLCDILRLPEQELLNLPIQQTLSEGVWQPQECLGVEHRLSLLDASVLWLSFSQSLVYDRNHAPLYFVAHIENITERKQTEETLQKQRYYLETAQEIGNIGAWEYDLVSAQMIWTKQTYKIFGVEEDAALSESFFFEHVHLDDRDYVEGEWRRALRGADYDLEHRVLVRQHIRWIKQKGSLVSNGEGTHQRLIGFAQDITERKRAEEELRLLTRELDTKVRMRSSELEKLNQTLLEQKKRAELLVNFSVTLLENVSDYRHLLQQVSEGVAELVGDGCVIAFSSEYDYHLRAEAIAHRDPQVADKTRELTQRDSYSLKTAQLSSLLVQGAQRFSNQSLTFEQAQEIFPPQLLPLVKKHGLTGVMGIPLVGRERPLGVIFVIRNNAWVVPFKEEEVAYLRSIASPLALSIENARLFDHLSGSREELRGFSQRLVEAQEKQIKNLARELHDRVGQNLTAININLSLLEQTLSAAQAAAMTGRLTDTRALVEETVAHMRNVIADFLPPMLENYGLGAALSWYGEDFSRRAGVVFHLEDALPARISPGMELSVFRIAQEALTNVAKYARARHVWVELRAEQEDILVSIKDDGVGFNPQQAREEKAHWGLTIMRERARAMNASLEIDSAPGKGARVILRCKRRQA